MNIYLIGYRATGKTTVGKCLAEKLRTGFVDADKYIEESARMPVSEIVSRFGWDIFRQKEKDAVSELTRQDNLVVATGGGVILDPDNIEKLRQTGTVVWLHAPADTIIDRMNLDPQTPTLRPPLTNGGGLSPTREVIDTLEHRLPLYQKAAHIRIDTHETDIQTICARVMESLATTTKE